MEPLKPVIVDLDGTLIKSDTLLECFMALLKGNLLAIFLLPFWLLKGKANLKSRIAERVEIDVTLLPYNHDVVDYIKSMRSLGHRCYLATGASAKVAEQVSNHVGLFDGIFSSTEETNLTGSRKAALLHEQFGAGNYIYLGNHRVDLAIWKDAAEAVVVSNSHSLVARARKVNSKVSQIAVSSATLKTWLKAIRVHQWVKNALLFVPLLTSHNLHQMDLVILCVLGFLAYSFSASSVYVLNDLLDLESDRHHPRKSKRPFASGALSITAGLVLFPLLLLLAFAISTLLPLPFFIALVCYYLLTLAYSFRLKKVIILDTLLLALLYTMRIIAGTVLIGVAFSFWLLAFSMFVFLSLALVKRYTELVVMQKEGNTKIAGRGYSAEDAPIVAALGASSGYMAVLVFALYVNSPDVWNLYTAPSVLWLACPVLLYWISRVWIIANRGEMHDDPIVFAVKDLQSIITGIFVLVLFVVASVMVMA